MEQLELESFDFTASTMLANGCFANTAIEITNNSKIWQANTDDWTDPNNWLPFGIPGDENCVIVKDNFSAEIPDGIHGKAKQFKVKNGGTATIKGNGVLTVHEEVIVEEEGIFTIENNGSLIQTTEAENTGAILVNRNASISKYDYVYWSSPLAPMVIDSLSPNTSSAYIYEWIPTIANSFGNWSNASGNMEIGKGYIIRAPNNYPVNIDQLFTANFTGTPNNGTITQTVQRGSYTGEDYQNSYGTTVTKYDDNQNLVGNPYPSAISADLFLQVNTNLEGAIELWTHGNDPSTASEASFYESFTYNYDASDYITYNATGASSGPASFDGYIASGQAFFVTMIDGETSTESITFTNDMRSNLYDNSQFFRMNTSETPSTTTTEGHIWLDLINNQNENVDRTLVGYIEGATNEKDRIYDAVTNLNTSLSIYSIINNNSLGIQGRALPFTSSDVVNLGIKTPQTGSYTIAIASTDGLFSTTEQEIYIEDLVLNTTHNLSNSPYNFTINTVGNIQERFILKFTDATMGNASVTRKETIIKATSLNPETIKVHSSLTPLSNIQIYDVTGKLIKEINHIEENAVLIPIQKTNSTLLLHISDSNQHIINRKIIH